jgi:hypothetical protein
MIEDDEIERFLKPFTPPVREAALKLRGIILEVMPDTIEQLDPSAKLIGYGTDRTYKGLICAIALHKAHVNLMFARGAELPDPTGILEGTGKKARHVKVVPGKPIGVTVIRALLKAAVDLHRP